MALIKKNVAIYKQVADFVTPLADDRGIGVDKTANPGLGGFVLVMDDGVWIQHFVDGEPVAFYKAVYNATFVELNTSIFERLR